MSSNTVYINNQPQVVLDMVNSQDIHGNTPLHLVAIQGQPDMLSAIIASGGNPSIKNKEGKTPGDLAISNGHLEAGKWLNSLIARNRVQYMGWHESLV